MEDFNTNQNQIIANPPKQPSLFSGTSKVLIGILLGVIFTVGIIGLYSTYYKKDAVSHKLFELTVDDKQITPSTITPPAKPNYGAASIICCKVTDRNFTPNRISYNWTVGADCESAAQRFEGYLIGETVTDNQCSGLKPDGVSF